jgi:VanZ family protein
MALALAATTFGNLHRYGSMDLLLAVFLLVTFWVVYSLVVSPLTCVRSPANLFLWGLLVLVLYQVLPLPRAMSLAPAGAPLPGAERILIESGYQTHHTHAGVFEVVRHSLRPAATLCTLTLFAAAAGLFWVVSSALQGRKSLRRLTWVVLLGAVPPALWVTILSLTSVGRAVPGVFRLEGPFLVLGGDSLVPALLAALPLAVAAALRLVGWMPRRAAGSHRRGWGWLARAGPVWAAIALALAGLMAVALGVSNVPRPWMLLCALLSVGFVLLEYVTSARGRVPTSSGGVARPRRPGRLAIGVLVWVLVALGVGFAVGQPPRAVASANEQLETLIRGMPGWRQALGVGVGAVSPHEIYGEAGWPRADGDDRDTSGYLVLQAEMGWVGLALVLGGAIAFMIFIVRALRRAKSPWPRAMMAVGAGVLAANLLYFSLDASALLVPNLIVIAAVLGLVAAWAVYGAAWRPGRRPAFAPAHWPLALAAVSLTGALATAENDMAAATTTGDHDINNKILHFGGFGVLTLFFCVALSPAGSARWLRARVLLATALSILVGVLVEYGQQYLTSTRTFAVRDMFIDAAGAVLMGLWWWLVHRAHVVESAAPESLPPSA